jgi:hypothetical protein
MSDQTASSISGRQLDATSFNKGREGDDNEEGLGTVEEVANTEKCMHERRSPREPPKVMIMAAALKFMQCLYQTLSLNLRFKLVLVHTLTLDELRIPGQ